jgi:hypothetical protein
MLLAFSLNILAGTLSRTNSRVPADVVTQHASGVQLIPTSYTSMESHGGMILTGATEELGEKLVPVPLCPPY